ncbi:MAG: TM0106 family RecB-like putative nuclease, partial [Candidatus Eremiobacteraeota bacterium]|nr:TM0106 family RecB-like putative nuclease [Candidatus Eremiobacteraeota bacterium]
QVQGRSDGPVYELLPHDPPRGFARVPAPAAGDVFFDMEGDPLFEPARGLEYLFGCWMPDDQPAYRAFWALDRDAEKAAFEEFVDFIVARRHAYPAMHVYHYGNYEKTALRKLAQVHCTRENEIDDLLRGEVLVDLYTVVRQAIAISEPRYGLKNVEKFYGVTRATGVRKGDESIVMFERWLLSHDETILADIEAYNQDDCRSTALLREWLLERRGQAIEQFGMPLPFRPVRSPREPCHPEFTAGCTKCENQRQREREEGRRSELEQTLLAGVLAPQSEDEYRAMHAEKRTRYLLGNLLAYHRREEKPAYWAYFDRREQVDDFVRDREAIGGLEFQEAAPLEKIKNSSVYTFRFPEQPHKLEAGDTPHDPATEPYKTTGTIVALDSDGNELRLKWTGSREQARAITALMPRHPLPTVVQHEAVGRIAEAFAQGALSRDFPATFGLLMAHEPRVQGIAPGARVQPAMVSTAAVSRLVAGLERSYLFVQGPPGSGKSTKSASVIADLLARGKRIGVTATGHKAIHHLLHKVERAMHDRGKTFRGLYKHTDGNPNSVYVSELTPALIASTGDNAQFDGSDYDLAAGTSWLFARKELTGAFDYLFIDEAGQVSLADALAVSACAKNLVLLGDPSQLAQVSQGVHPLHAGDSVLQHLLGEAQTVPSERGVFLDVSYRMHPNICRYVSDASYDGRLEPDPRTALHAIVVNSQRRTGLEYSPIEHAGNASSSREEADFIAGQIQQLLAGELTDSWPPAECGVPRAMTERDIIVVTPYNAQRRLITNVLKSAGIDGVRVGTVDKFQGQEAAVVFYSMATSSGDDVPRDVGFLFERNRFNVAISRARALSILVCSPRLLDIDCRTPEQMALVNLLCAFAEEAGGAA